MEARAIGWMTRIDSGASNTANGKATRCKGEDLRPAYAAVSVIERSPPYKKEREHLLAKDDRLYENTISQALVQW